MKKEFLILTTNIVFIFLTVILTLCALGVIWVPERVLIYFVGLIALAFGTKIYKMTVRINQKLDELDKK